jgi:predicted CopG family antitoxin
MAKKLIVKFPNDAEYEQLKKDAHRHEKNISDYIRWLIEKQRKEDEGK